MTNVTPVQKNMSRKSFDVLGALTADMIRFGLRSVLLGTVVIGKDGRGKVISGAVNQAELKK